MLAAHEGSTHHNIVILRAFLMSTFLASTAFLLSLPAFAVVSLLATLSFLAI